MLASKIQRRVQQSKILQISETQGVHSTSGLRATVFGATGFLGEAVGSALGYIGSDMIYPSRDPFKFCDPVKKLRLTGQTGMVYTNHNTNFADPRILRRCVAQSNCVVNLIGARRESRRLDQFEKANVEVARSIAKQCRLAGVKRLVHISNVGADPKSPSPDLQTKFHGEEAVLEEFPEATILRLGTVVGISDHFQRIFRAQAGFFQNFVPVYSDLSARRQPILDTDVAKAVLNSLKIAESAGQTYEVVGPHVYTLKQLYEVMMNILQRPLTFAKINPRMATFASRYFSYEYFNFDAIVKENIDLVARGEGKSIEELFVKPASIMPMLEYIQKPWAEIVSPSFNDTQI